MCEKDGKSEMFVLLREKERGRNCRRELGAGANHEVKGGQWL